MGQLSRRNSPKGRKGIRPRENQKPASQGAPKRTLSAESVIEEVTARADELQMPIREVIARALRAHPEPDIDLSTLFKRHMLKNPRFLMWAMDPFYGKPQHQAQTTGAGGGPMQIKVVIETIGEEE